MRTVAYLIPADSNIPMVGLPVVPVPRATRVSLRFVFFMETHRHRTNEMGVNDFQNGCYFVLCPFVPCMMWRRWYSSVRCLVQVWNGRLSLCPRVGI